MLCVTNLLFASIHRPHALLVDMRFVHNELLACILVSWICGPQWHTRRQGELHAYAHRAQVCIGDIDGNDWEGVWVDCRLALQSGQYK